MSVCKYQILDHSKGEILRASKRRRSEGYHYILAWSDFDEGMDFTGIMLTTSTSYPDNIPMDISHFQQGTELDWHESQHFVNRLFVKFAAWGPFKNVGELTEQGIRFVEENLQDIEPVPFEEYLAERRSA